MWERGSSTHVDAPRPSITGAKIVVITRRCTRPFKDFFCWRWPSGGQWECKSRDKNHHVKAPTWERLKCVSSVQVRVIKDINHWFVIITATVWFCFYLEVRCGHVPNESRRNCKHQLVEWPLNGILRKYFVLGTIWWQRSRHFVWTQS